MAAWAPAMEAAATARCGTLCAAVAVGLRATPGSVVVVASTGVTCATDRTPASAAPTQWAG
jgi:hypothetical protein